MSDVTFERLAPLVSAGWDRLSTLLAQGGRQAAKPEGAFVNVPIERGSTMLYPSLGAMRAGGQNPYDHHAIYGAMGNPVQHTLEVLLAEIEGGRHAQIVSSGLAACTTPLLAFLRAGDHLLLPDSVYSPTRRFADTVLARFGVRTTYYPPCVDEAAISALIEPQTKVLFAESPGSHTFEVQDVAMLGRVAHARGALLMLDNTWGIGAFAPFEHGVDVSIQALTKYPGGHSDLILGAVTVADETLWRSLRDCAIQLGQCGGPEDSWLTLRGLRTMGVRLKAQALAALEIALWLRQRPEVASVLHPAFPECPGHALWRRDFTAASGLFGVEFAESVSTEAMEAMIDSLQHFGIGASWGGYESLVLPTTGSIRRSLPQAKSGPALRLQIGLEAVSDLIADLEQGMERLR